MRSPLNTWAMKAPSGGAVTATSAKNDSDLNPADESHESNVRERALLELFGAHERVDEIDHDDHDDRCRRERTQASEFFLALGARAKRDVEPQRGEGADADDQHENVRARHPYFSSCIRPCAGEWVRPAQCFDGEGGAPV